MISFFFQIVFIGVSWLPRSQQSYRFWSLIEARICTTGRALLDPKVGSRGNGIVESRETARVLYVCHHVRQRSRVQSSRKKAAHSDSRRAWALRPFPRVLFFATRKKVRKAILPRRRESTTSQLSSLFTLWVSRVSSIPAPTFPFRHCPTKIDLQSLRKYFII